MKTDLEGIYTEISAGRALFTNDERSRAWNDAHERCLNIVLSYMHGKGLFQLVTSTTENPALDTTYANDIPVVASEEKEDGN